MPGQKSIADYQQRLSHLERDLANVMQENRRMKNRLLQIHGVIDVVEQRCLAADGPVTKTHDEITDNELRRIYKLSES